MSSILSEKEYQKYILKKLAASGYEVQPADHYDRLFAVSRTELMRFLETTQPDEMESLKKIYKEKTEEVIVSALNYPTRLTSDGVVQVNCTIRYFWCLEPT